MSQDIAPLLPALRALEERASAAHRQEILAERKLLTELEELERMRAKAYQEAAALGVRQKLGVDGLWHGWLLQRRAQINRELALSRARYAATLQAAQFAFARRSQAEKIVEATASDSVKQREAKRQIATDHLVLMEQFKNAGS